MNTVEKILSHTSNRSFPLPERKWKYYQEWHDTLFVHWKVLPYSIEKHIPEGTQLDTFDGFAWVSLVAFEVKKMRLKNMPSIPYINKFQEINIRTYVMKDCIPGIYMFSVETDKFIQVLLSRLLIGIKYQKATIRRDRTKLSSHNYRNGYGIQIDFSYLNSPVKKTATDIWLTERHALYENQNGKLYRFDVHHKEWKLKKLIASLNSIKYKAGDFDLNVYPDAIYYCKKLQTLLWGRIPVSPVTVENR
jgi:uncharacterized protein YqjF (DUF2071 family)